MFLGSYFFAMCFFVGFVFLVTGFFLHKNPPKDKNKLLGYRTHQSLKSDENWNYAQSYSAKQIMKAGVFLMACSPIGLLYDSNLIPEILIALSLIIIVSLYPIYKTEKELLQFNI